MMNEQYSIKIKDVTKNFKIKKFDREKKNFSTQLIKAIDNVSMVIPHGKVVGIIGRNGSGKTTLLRIMAGILQPDIGQVSINGSIGPLLQIGLGFNDENTVEENVILNGLLFGFNKKWIQDKVTEILEFAELTEFRKTKMKVLSSGMKSRIMFSTTLMLDPQVLLVDEVMSVGDLEFRQKSFNAFQEFKKKDRTVVLVSHNMSQVRKICDLVFLLDKGKIIDYGQPEKVIDTYTASS